MDIEKKCGCCGEFKLLSEFSKNKSRKDGLQVNCKICTAEYFKEYRKKDNYKEIQKRFSQSEKGKEARERYKESGKKKETEDKYYEKRKELNKKFIRSEKGKEYLKEYRKSDKQKEYKKKYRQLEKTKKYQNEYFKNRKDNDIQFKLACNLRSRLYQAIKTGAKIGSAVDDLGCSIEFFKNHIEQQFKEGMSWDNHGEWHLDHILPLSLFNLEDREEFRYACYYLNYQPLWAIENISKGNKLN